MKNRAFTLVELLVVIAVIALLASIVFISLGGARDKARIAAGMQFSSSIHHALGAYAVGIWDFDDGTANDSSGNNNNGTINGAILRCTPDYTPSEEGCSYEFDGNTDTILLSSAVNQSTITVSMWYYYENIGGGSWNTLLGRNNGTYHHLLINDTTKEVGFYNNSWYSSGYSLDLDNWYHIVLIKDGTNSKLYINNDLKQDSNNSFDNNTYPLLTIGNYINGGSQGSIGYIDGVRAYERTLSGSQIQKLYVEGARYHRIVSE